MMDTVNKPKIKYKKIILIILFIVFTYIILYTSAGIVGRNIKRSIMYEAMINYAMDNNLELNIDNCRLTEFYVTENFMADPIDRQKDRIYYNYSFERKNLDISKIGDDGVLGSAGSEDYYYDYEKFFDKYDLKTQRKFNNLFREIQL